MLEKMSYCLFHTGKNTSFSLFIIFFSFFLWSCRSGHSDSSPAYILLLYTSWLIWPRCHTTIVNLQWTHMYKKSLLFKNRFVGPQKLKKVETEKHKFFSTFFFHLFLSARFFFGKNAWLRPILYSYNCRAVFEKIERMGKIAVFTVFGKNFVKATLYWLY